MLSSCLEYYKWTHLFPCPKCGKQCPIFYKFIGVCIAGLVSCNSHLQISRWPLCGPSPAPPSARPLVTVRQRSKKERTGWQDSWAIWEMQPSQESPGFTVYSPLLSLSDPGSLPRAWLEMFYDNSEDLCVGQLTSHPLGPVKCGVHSIKSTILSFRGLLHKAAPGKPMIIWCLLTSPRHGLVTGVATGSVSPRVGVHSGHGRGLFVVSTSQTKTWLDITFWRNSYCSVKSKRFVWIRRSVHSRGGTKTWTQDINCKQSVVRNIIIIKRLHTHKHILRLKWYEILTSISV